MNCQCGQESEVGTHMVLNGEVFSVYYCLTCYNKKDKNV